MLLDKLLKMKFPLGKKSDGTITELHLTMAVK